MMGFKKFFITTRPVPDTAVHRIVAAPERPVRHKIGQAVLSDISDSHRPVAIAIDLCDRKVVFRVFECSSSMLRGLDFSTHPVPQHARLAVKNLQW